MLWQCPDKRGTQLGLWHLSLPGVWHMTWCCTGKTAAPYSCSRTTMSSRRFSWLPLPISKKFKVKMSKSVVSNDQIGQASWQLTASRNCLRMNPQTSWQRTSVPLWRPHFWRRIPRRRWEDWFILSCHVSDEHLHTGTGWKWTSNRLGDEGAYFCGAWGPRYGDEFEGGGEMIDSYPTLSDTYLNPEIVWKTPGGHSLDIKVFHDRRERDFKGVAVCSSFHSSSVDTRGSWSRT